MPPTKNSGNVLDGVEPTLVANVGRLQSAMAAIGYGIKPVQGLRTAEYQHSLWQQGRERPGEIVTNADGFKSKSNHQAKADGYGHAVDFCFLDQNGVPSFSSHWPWAAIGALAEALGLVWGGRFNTPTLRADLGHVELPMHVGLSA